MSDAEELVPSAPLATELQHPLGRLFERIRRNNVGTRTCSPCDNTWVAVDRIVDGAGVGLLFHVHANANGSDAIRRDLLDRDLTVLGFAPRHQLRQPGGQIDVVTDGPPGVRLRALIEAMNASGRALPREVVWHLLRRSVALREAWDAVGVAPGDTFVAFDGSVHLFPRLVACFDSEMPSFNGDEVFDALVVDRTLETLGQALCAAPPRPYVSMTEAEFARAMRAVTGPARELLLRNHPPWVVRDDPAVRRAVGDLLARPPADVDATSTLAALVCDAFPRARARQREVYGAVGRDPEGEGLARESAILALRGAAPASSPAPGDAPWLRRLWTALRGRW